MTDSDTELSTNNKEPSKYYRAGAIVQEKVKHYGQMYLDALKNGANWDQLTSILETPVAKLSLLAPILGQVLIYFNEDSGRVHSFLADRLDISSVGTYILYWSLVLVAIARLTYMLTCPKAVRTYKTLDDYIAVKKQTLSYREMVIAWQDSFQLKMQSLNCDIDIEEIDTFFHPKNGTVLDGHGVIHRKLFGEPYPPYLHPSSAITGKKPTKTNKQRNITDIVLRLINRISYPHHPEKKVPPHLSESNINLPRDDASNETSFVSASHEFLDLLSEYTKHPGSSQLLFGTNDDGDFSDTSTPKQNKQLNALSNFIARGDTKEQWQYDAISYLWEHENSENSKSRRTITWLIGTLPLCYVASKSLFTIAAVTWLTTKSFFVFTMTTIVNVFT